MLRRCVTRYVIVVCECVHYNNFVYIIYVASQPRLSWLAAVWTLFVRGLTVNCMIIWSYFFANAITAGSAYAALRCVAALTTPPLQT